MLSEALYTLKAVRPAKEVAENKEQKPIRISLKSFLKLIKNLSSGWRWIENALKLSLKT